MFASDPFLAPCQSPETCDNFYIIRRAILTALIKARRSLSGNLLILDIAPTQGLSERLAAIPRLDYSSRLEEVSFTVRLDNFVSSLSARQLKRYAIQAGEDIHVCSKPS